MAGEQKLNFIYDENSAKPKEEDYLLGKSVDANYEKGTMGQINAVEYGNCGNKFIIFRYFSDSRILMFQIVYRNPYFPQRLNIKWTFNENCKKIL